ncbi:MAG: V-type ATP synthase subunit D [Deltaproteobacteria bacterium]|nr:V-type ATP synthase subunit D [Deltaproteobacteria bacterium]
MRQPATRMNLMRARRRAAHVARGVELLQRKREALVRRLFELARPAADARARTIEQAARAYAALLRALASHGDADLQAIGWPTRELRIAIETGVIWGVSIAQLETTAPLRRTFEARGTPPVTVGPAAAEAAAAFEELAERLIEAAGTELPVRRIAEALARTTRQAHVLEQRIGPALRAEIVSAQRTLEEREREEHLRVRRVLARRAGPGARV